MVKQYLRSFLKQDEGMETIEYIAVLCVAAGLVVIIGTLADKLSGKANSQIDYAMSQIPGNEDGSTYTPGTK